MGPCLESRLAWQQEWASHHQSLLADGLLNLHLRFSSKTGITLITGLQHHAHNMPAQAERQAEVDDIHELGLIQSQFTAPDNWP